MNRGPRIRETVIRQTRASEVEPTPVQAPPVRRPNRFSNTSNLLLLGFLLLIISGGLLLATPFASNGSEFTSLEVSFFTAVSAATVTGHTMVNTATHWSHFGQAIIFLLMLVGGLGFMAVATFLLALIGQRSTLPERLVMRDAVGTDRMEGLRRVSRNVVIVVFLIYVLGAVMLFWRIDGIDGIGLGESLWQSAFLSVSSFNNAGFSIFARISRRHRVGPVVLHVGGVGIHDGADGPGMHRMDGIGGRLPEPPVRPIQLGHQAGYSNQPVSVGLGSRDFLLIRIRAR